MSYKSSAHFKDGQRTWALRPQGLKSAFILRQLAARLKSCPHTMRVCIDAERVLEARLAGKLIFAGLLLLLLSPLVQVAQAQKTAWRQATDAELASLLPARAPVEKEHIETEMRTASGIVNGRGRFIAGVVLITAGYSAEGKYSHYLIVQAPVRIGGVGLKPGEYAFGWVRKGDALNLHFNEAATGKLIGTANAHRIPGAGRVESLRIWPPAEKAMIQIGRFGISYEAGEE